MDKEQIKAKKKQMKFKSLDDSYAEPLSPSRFPETSTSEEK